MPSYTRIDPTTMRKVTACNGKFFGVAQGLFLVVLYGSKQFKESHYQ